MEIIEPKSDERNISSLRKELTDLGLEELHTSEAVEQFLREDGPKMVVVNSTCKCAGEALREAVKELHENNQLPDRVGTVFAGEDEEATATLRNWASSYEPSSPAAYFFRDHEAQAYLSRDGITETDYETEEIQEKIRRNVHRINTREN